MPRCPLCGATGTRGAPVLWPELAEGWGLTTDEQALVDRQQGETCARCGAGRQARALALAVAGCFGGGRWFPLALARHPGMRILEVNEAGDLHRWLRRMPRHLMTTYPDVDLQALPMADDTYDLVIHSEVLEHIEDPAQAIREARRVLRPGGWHCFTVPMIPSRATRRTEGRPPTYHGNPQLYGVEGLRVRTEYGADAWTQLAEAGFRQIRLYTELFPASVAFAARA